MNDAVRPSCAPQTGILWAAKHADYRYVDILGELIDNSFGAEATQIRIRIVAPKHGILAAEFEGKPDEERWDDRPARFRLIELVRC